MLRGLLLRSRPDGEDQSAELSTLWKPAAVLIAPLRRCLERRFHANVTPVILLPLTSAAFPYGTRPPLSARPRVLTLLLPFWPRADWGS